MSPEHGVALHQQSLQQHAHPQTCPLKQLFVAQCEVQAAAHHPQSQLDMVRRHSTGRRPRPMPKRVLQPSAHASLHLVEPWAQDLDRKWTLSASVLPRRPHKRPFGVPPHEVRLEPRLQRQLGEVARRTECCPRDPLVQLLQQPGQDLAAHRRGAQKEVLLEVLTTHFS